MSATRALRLNRSRQNPRRIPRPDSLQTTTLANGTPHMILILWMCPITEIVSLLSDGPGNDEDSHGKRLEDWP